MGFDYNFKNGITKNELLNLSKRMKINVEINNNIDINKNGAYIFKLKNNKDNEKYSHWVGLYKFDKYNYIYYDSLGNVPPQRIIDKVKIKNDTNFYFNPVQIQDLKSKTSGFFVLLFLYYIEDYKNDKDIKHLHELINDFDNLFFMETEHNDYALLYMYENIFKLRHLK